MSSRFGKDMDLNDETSLEDGPIVDFHGATLQIQHETLHSRSPSSVGDESDFVKLAASPDKLEETNVLQSDSPNLTQDIRFLSSSSNGGTTVSSLVSIPKRISETLRQARTHPAESSNSGVICSSQIVAQEDAKDFFSYRDGLVENAVQECISKIVSTEVDGAVLGNWLLTEISLWDNEKERLILLTEKSLITVKYDFIALKQLDFKRVPIPAIDTLVIGDLIYPSGSLVPRLNGVATGVVTVVKGCLLRPLQERWTRVQGNNDFCASPFDFTCFEPRSRNVRGVRAMWNRGEPLKFSKKWNPFNNEIPWTTYTSHPLFWHKEGGSKTTYDVEDFIRTVVSAVERCQKTETENAALKCLIEHKPIILQNYIGLSSLIHNRNALGFFKVRGKFSF